LKNFIRHEFPVVKRITLPDVRLYETPSGNRYPSVTTVTGQETKHHIEAWRKRVGDVVADRISKQAADRGTRVHSYCENFLLSESFTADIFDVEMWNTLKPVVDRIDNIHALEAMLYSDKLRMAGTVDCIGEYNGLLSVIDFKTSKRPKQREDIQHYFVQATAYSVMFEELFGIAIPDITIIIGVDDDSPQVFQARRKDYIKKLVELRLQYDKISVH
jgi:genome maintenance exonuclease 1